MPIVVIILITTISIILLSQGNTPSSRKVAGASTSPTYTLTPTNRRINSVISPSIFETSPTSSTFNTSRENNTWQYPGATRIDLGGGTFYYQSSDNPQSITDWYKEKISDFQLNGKTFITNNVNGNVENKLQASNGKTFISVIIEKKLDDASTKITVKISE